MELLFSSVKSIIVFLLLVTVFMNLIGKSTFKQYISIFVGLVLIIIVIRPVLTLFNASDKVDHYFNMNMYQSNAKDLSNELYQVEEKYKERVVNEYKATIQTQIETILDNYALHGSKVEIAIEEDPEKNNCGEILAIHIVASSVVEEEDATETVTSDVEKIDQVVIDKININSKSSNIDEKAEETMNTDSFDSVMELTVKQDISSLYGISMKLITVNIVK